MLWDMELSGKLLSWQELRFERDRLAALGKKLVFTNGCFDLLHAGHVEYLCFARRQGDALAVGLNADASVRRSKGPTRPVVAEAHRAHLLLALRCVDYVTLFEQDEPRELIETVIPHVLVKGNDWSHYVSGREAVEAQGGRVVLADMVAGLSTSALFDKILRLG